MKVTITDKEALAALSWEALKAYLDASDWQCAEDTTGKAAAYQHTDDTGRLWEILVPLRRDLGDYVSRMGDAVTILAHIEDRSELDVYEDLRALGAGAPQVDDATRAVHQRIRRWLAEEGCQIQDIRNPNSLFYIAVRLQGGQGIRMLQSVTDLDRIVIAQQVLLSADSQVALAQIPPTDLNDLVWGLRRDATMAGVDLEGLESPLQALWHLASVYFDGLTKDTLFQRIMLVVRAAALSAHTLARGLDIAERPAAADELRRHSSSGGTSQLMSAAS